MFVPLSERSIPGSNAERSEYAPFLVCTHDSQDFCRKFSITGIRSIDTSHLTTNRHMFCQVPCGTMQRTALGPLIVKPFLASLEDRHRPDRNYYFKRSCKAHRSVPDCKSNCWNDEFFFFLHTLSTGSGAARTAELRSQDSCVSGKEYLAVNVEEPFSAAGGYRRNMWCR